MYFTSKQLAVYIFMIYFCFLFVFQTIIPYYVGAAAVMAAIPVLAYERMSITIRAYVFPILLLYAIMLLWSTEPHKSFVYFFILIEALVFIRPDEKDMRLALDVIKRAAIVYAIFVFVTKIFPNLMCGYAELVFFDRATVDGYIRAIQKGYCPGINHQIGYTALYIVLGMFAYVYDYEITKKKKYSRVIFLFMALLLTNKRSALLFFVIILLMIYFFNATPKQKLNRFIKLLIAFVGSVVLLIVVANLFPSVPIFNRFLSLFTMIKDGTGDANKVLSGRLAIYRNVLELYDTHKWFGIGWENFSDFSRARSASGKPNQGHNVFLQLLAEVGIVGFIPVILINLYYLGICFKRNRFIINYLTVNQKRTFVYGTCRCCSMAFMIFYYLFWFSGNALYDIPLLYTWLVSIWLCVSINKQHIVQSSNL